MSFEDFFTDTFFLETERVTLRPLQETDFTSFTNLAQSSILWKYFTKELNDEVQLKAWLKDAVTERSEKKRFPFTAVEKSSGLVCGSTSLGNISFFDKRVEIGWTWVGEAYLGSGINHHCKYALLKFAFEKLLFERVEIKTDNLNERAKQALRKIGAKEEGVLRSHMQMPHNRRRDSVYFSILKSEWPEVKATCFSSI